jgi:hypothetical protein
MFVYTYGAIPPPIVACNVHDRLLQTIRTDNWKTPYAGISRIELLTVDQKQLYCMDLLKVDRREQCVLQRGTRNVK